MELRQLRYFATLAEELHFGRAAKRLSLTQPPLSQAILNLERELGVRLFERSRRRVELTHAGRAFLDEAQQTLLRAERAADRARRAGRGEVGRLAVGFLANTAYTLLPPVLSEFARRFPGVSLDLRELTIPQQIEALRRGNIDVGLLRPPVADAEIVADTVLEEPFVLALPQGHPLCELKRVPLKRLADETFVLFPRTTGFVFHDLIMGYFLRGGFTPRVAQEVNQTHAVVGLVSAGIGVALVPASARKIGLAGVEYRPMREATPLARVAIARRRADASPVVAAFLEVAHKVAAQVDSEHALRR